MRQPPGIMDDNLPRHVCQLRKSIYGLKQLSKIWFRKLRDTITAREFKESLADLSLFIHDGNHADIDYCN